MRTTINKIGTFLFLVLILVSCNDDFLERYPLDELSNETFWKTEKDLEVYNNSIYDLTRTDENSVILFGHFELRPVAHHPIIVRPSGKDR